MSKPTTRGDTVLIFINTNRSRNPGIFLVKIPEECSDCSGHEDRKRDDWSFDVVFESGEV